MALKVRFWRLANAGRWLIVLCYIPTRHCLPAGLRLTALLSIATLCCTRRLATHDKNSLYCATLRYATLRHATPRYATVYVIYLYVPVPSCCALRCTHRLWAHDEIKVLAELHHSSHFDVRQALERVHLVLLHLGGQPHDHRLALRQWQRHTYTYACYTEAMWHTHVCVLYSSDGATHTHMCVTRR